MSDAEIQYDIAFSFAGEDRYYVEQVALALREKGVKVFYDNFETISLWGKDLYQYLSDIYSKKSRLVVIFISESYSKKLWTNHELRAAQERAFNEKSEYILPARFDDAVIPGIHQTTGYIGLTNRSPNEFSELIIQKLVSLGHSIPSDILRRDYFSKNIIPSQSKESISITTKCDNSPIMGCSIALVSENGIAILSKTDVNGVATFKINVRKIYDILISHQSFPGYVINNFDPINDIEINLPQQENIGSQIIRSTGYIPIISGRLNPILDRLGRTYLYADNISINNGSPQPVDFKIDCPLELEDLNGTICLISFKYIKSNIFLIQYMYRSISN